MRKYVLKGGGNLQKERRGKIRALLGIKPFVSLDELSEMFPDVSEMTLRRDIEYFEANNEAIKVRGGCRSMTFIAGGDVQMVNASTHSAKHAIARAAAELLETGRSIFVDSGTTMRIFTEYVPERRYSFTTTDPQVALKLASSGTSTVNIVGGRLEGENRTVTGLQASRFLSDINIDIAFMTPTCYSEESGFTVASFNECELKRIVVEKARVVVMMVNSEKCNRSLPYTFCTLGDTDVIITDKASPEELLRTAEKLGCKTILAD